MPGLVLTGIVALAVVVAAHPAHLQMFRRVEKPPPKSQLDKARCLTCHTKPGGGKQLNPYGLDFRENAANEESLRKIRPLDSDQDGSTNANEIKAGTLPGDGKSKPTDK
ncbi:MAG: hypothetical protein ACYC0V_20300 [Armatimonadota bacterium]